MRVLAKTTSFWNLLWRAPRFMQDRKSKDYDFTIDYMELGRTLLLGTLGQETIKTRNHIVNCGYYNKL